MADDNYSAGFKDGVIFGLRATLHAGRGWVAREIRRLEERSGRPVDGEAEWRSWNVDLDLGIIELAKLRRGADRRHR